MNGDRLNTVLCMRMTLTVVVCTMNKQIFKFIDMGTFPVGIKVEFKIIQYVYAYVISQ